MKKCISAGEIVGKFDACFVYFDERPMVPHNLKTLNRYYFDADDYAINLDETPNEPKKLEDFTESALRKLQALDTYYTRHLYDELMLMSPMETKLYRETLLPAMDVFQTSKCATCTWTCHISVTCKRKPRTT